MVRLARPLQTSHFLHLTQGQLAVCLVDLPQQTAEFIQIPRILADPIPGSRARD
jgi:hypothetical protein